jgi:hypothetical protein
MIEVFLTTKRTIDRLQASAFFIDSQGYKVVFETRTTGSTMSIRKSIKSHFDSKKEDFVIILETV